VAANTFERYCVQSQEMEERPEGYIGPDLDPEGLVLEPRELAPGVYALLANRIPKDNNGLIVGDRAALVVDAGMNGAVAHQIQELAARLTDRPIRPLFPEGYKDDVQVVLTVLSTDQQNDPDVIGTIAASAALTIS